MRYKYPTIFQNTGLALFVVSLLAIAFIFYITEGEADPSIFSIYIGAALCSLSGLLYYFYMKNFALLVSENSLKLVTIFRTLDLDFNSIDQAFYKSSLNESTLTLASKNKKITISVFIEGYDKLVQSLQQKISKLTTDNSFRLPFSIQLKLWLRICLLSFLVPFLIFILYILFHDFKAFLQEVGAIHDIKKIIIFISISFMLFLLIYSIAGLITRPVGYLFKDDSIVIKYFFSKVIMDAAILSSINFKKDESSPIAPDIVTIKFNKRTCKLYQYEVDFPLNVFYSQLAQWYLRFLNNDFN